MSDLVGNPEELFSRNEAHVSHCFYFIINSYVIAIENIQLRILPCLHGIEIMKSSIGSVIEPMTSQNGGQAGRHGSKMAAMTSRSRWV